MSQRGFEELSRRVAVHCEEPSGELIACLLSMSASGDRIVTATSGMSEGNAGMLRLVERMLEGEFDTVVALPSLVRLDLSRPHS